MRDQNIRTPVSRVGNKTAILHIIYNLFPLEYGIFIDVFGGSGSVLLGRPKIDGVAEVYNDIDRNLTNLFNCMKYRSLALIREIGFCIMQNYIIEIPNQYVEPLLQCAAETGLSIEEIVESAIKKLLERRISSNSVRIFNLFP